MSEQQRRNEIVAWLLLLMSCTTLGYVAGKSGWSVDPRTWIPAITPVAGPRIFALIHETGDDSAEFSSLKVGLRKDDIAKPLAAKGHTLLILDKDQAEKYKPKEGWPALPFLVVTDGKATIATEAIPSQKLADVVKLLEKHGGPLK